ncbi:MAG TPA: prepilin-type N-terminal cleavage/methylation domain-containing protein [Candidatus Angelobacter sp.]|nr:prepilin-type N-terminal cleavage/methylation domain-containing protein [Candidatus Angelobacter sp.]
MAGFTLAEMLMVVAVLTIVTGAIFRQIGMAQKNYRAESQKLDFTEQQRTFADQFTRDLRQAGYPTALSMGPGAAANQVASGNLVINPAGTSLTMEGDLDGSGIVQVVTYDYNAATGSLERTASQKGLAVNPPLTIVQNVLPPVANPPLFQPCDATGNCAPNPIGAVKSVRVNFTLQGTNDARMPAIQTTMTATARLPNF